MRPERRQAILLTILVILLGAAVYLAWPRPTGSARPTSNVKGVAKPGNSPAGITAPDVHLEALEANHQKPGEVERNLFRFKPKPPPAPPRVVQQPVAPPPVPTGPPPPPPLPPITLKFIGVIESENAGKVAILSDGRGGPVYGKEGDTVLGQYKIVRIGAESIEMTYLDGRGRQSIRLSGS